MRASCCVGSWTSNSRPLLFLHEVVVGLIVSQIEREPAFPVPDVAMKLTGDVGAGVVGVVGVSFERVGIFGFVGTIPSTRSRSDIRTRPMIGDFGGFAPIQSSGGYRGRSHRRGSGRPGQSPEGGRYIC